ncbi:MAG: carboxypeptidase regulatory-like domain-containing protein [Planctomycetes bacterium]|nr:carboxypeptidase regulatory-like domain-containing protein [Planctomycetota bacterium]
MKRPTTILLALATVLAGLTARLATARPAPPPPTASRPAATATGTVARHAAVPRPATGLRRTAARRATVAPAAAPGRLLIRVDGPAGVARSRPRTVTLCAADDGRRRSTGVDLRGVATFRSLPSGSWRATLNIADSAYVGELGDVAMPDGADLEVALSAPPAAVATVDVRHADPTVHELVVPIEVCVLAPGLGGGAPIPLHRTRLRLGTPAELGPLAPGRWPVAIRVLADAAEPVCGELRVDGGDTPRLDVELRAPVAEQQLELAVHDSAGRPLADARLSVAPAAGPAAGLGDRTAITDASGRARVALWSDARYRIRVEAPGRVGLDALVSAPRDGTPLQVGIRLAPLAELQLTVADPGIVAIRASRIDPDGALPVRVERGVDDLGALALPAGSWRIEGLGRDGVRRALRVELTPGARVRAELR